MLFFIDLTFEHLTWALVGAATLLILLGSIAGALKSVRGEFWTPLKNKIWKPRLDRQQRLADLFANVDEIKTSVNSQTDVLNSVHRKVENMQGWQWHQDETSEAASFQMDPDAKMTYANRKLCEFLDVDKTDLLKMNWLSRVHGIDQERIRKEFQLAIENKMPVDSIVKFRVPGTVAAEFRVTALPHVRSGGELLGFFGKIEQVEQQQMVAV